MNSLILNAIASINPIAAIPDDVIGDDRFMKLTILVVVVAIGIIATYIGNMDLRKKDSYQKKKETRTKLTDEELKELGIKRATDGSLDFSKSNEDYLKELDIKRNTNSELYFSSINQDR